MGKAKERRLCCGPQLEVQISPQSLCGENMVGWWIPPHPALPSDQGSCVCCIKQSAFAAACKVFACFMLYFRATIQQVPVGGWDRAVVSPKRALAVPEGRTAILSF